MKKYYFFFFFLLIGIVAFANPYYQITDVSYFIEGTKLKFIPKTKLYPLQEAVDIDKDKIFSSYEELQSYLENLKQQFTNLRTLESSEIIPTIQEFKIQDNIIPVKLVIKTKDSWNLFPLPYPKYDSNDGFIFKLKIKDYNFLGTMKTFDFDINYTHKTYPNEQRPDDHLVGFNFSFDWPFKMAIFDSIWKNDFSLDFVFGEKAPNFHYETGLSLSLPLNQFNLELELSQGVTQDDYYETTNDKFYFTEKAEVRIPFKVAEIANFGMLYWTPYANFTFNWDISAFHGTNVFDSVIHEDLSGPRLKVGSSISTSRINWKSNFRKGMNLKIEQYYKYNNYTKIFSPVFSGEIALYENIKFMGFYSRIHSFVDLNDTTEIGKNLRGIIDNSYKTNTALTMNFDMPITLIKTDWTKWGFTKFLPFMSLLNFEMQFSPFIDISLGYNTHTGTYFNLKDGYYTAGAEIIVFPNKMRSIHARLSIGLDLTHFIPDSFINKAWRNKDYTEVYFGIGLFY